MRIRILLLLATFVVFPFLPAIAQNDAYEDRLRAALRDATEQLRNAQAELAVHRAEKELDDAEIRRLRAQLENSARQHEEMITVARAEAESLRKDLDERRAEAARLAESLKRSMDAHDEAKRQIALRDRENREASQRLVELQRIVEERERQNLELHRLGMEILRRYEDFGMGRAITAREPFTGITRARLKTLVQDYQDRIDDMRVRGGADDASPEN